MIKYEREKTGCFEQHKRGDLQQQKVADESRDSRARGRGPKTAGERKMRKKKLASRDGKELTSSRYCFLPPITVIRGLFILSHE